uniref:Uncharacterized protein n=1 Tax=Cyprinus carpio TaxID=7962 RepID=A0A8C1WV69_CYPCA
MDVKGSSCNHQFEEVKQKKSDDPAEASEPREVCDTLVGKQVECENKDGTQRMGTIIQQVQAKPSVYFIKFEDDYHIYVYDMVGS